MKDIYRKKRQERIRYLGHSFVWRVEEYSLCILAGLTLAGMVVAFIIKRYP